jgi:Ni/Co efflux regulator RcnB
MQGRKQMKKIAIILVLLQLMGCSEVLRMPDTRRAVEKQVEKQKARHKEEREARGKNPESARAPSRKRRNSRRGVGTTQKRGERCCDCYRYLISDYYGLPCLLP